MTHYSPDILNCLANLSSDEVFTSPELANRMLDLLPQELFRSPKTRFLDPCSKSGVFLREIAKRLLAGLEGQIPDLQQRIDHIMTRQVFGIACTDLTAEMSRRTLYRTKQANGKYSVSTALGDRQGHILYDRCRHTWDARGRCVHCGASQGEYLRADSRETYAYPFIHKPIKEIFKKDMQFDVIIGNPPYQMSDGGFGISAMPIYDRFITQAKKINPRFLVMIVPARWYAGGKGLDDFRDEMLHDNRLRIIHDYPQAFECFPGVQIKGGVCYFLWSRDNRGDCSIITHQNGEVGNPVLRPLLEKGSDVFIRYNEAISILHKVIAFKEPTLANKVSSRQPFGLSTNYHGEKEHNSGDLKLYENQGESFVSNTMITKNRQDIGTYKVFISRAGSGSDSFPHPILGVPFVGSPNTVCSETYIYIGPFVSKEECENVISYIKTRFMRFLVMLRKVTQSTTKEVYKFVPLQDFSHPWTDEMLYKKYDLDKDEIAFIESMIRPME
ncbi:MAG: Eco57I restriction-modification methylase domain-containing protein [Bacteroidales bacterium]|nr:Eco57I restriction-modification methylase domain-containing protein [Bacteroidales bacterium]